MKLSAALLGSLLALSASSVYADAGHPQDGAGYNNRLHQGRGSHQNCGGSVRVASVRDYQGAGSLSDCRQVSTYQGGPKTGSWQTYYVCHLDY